MLEVDKGDYAAEPGGLRKYVDRAKADALMILTPNQFHADHLEEVVPLGIPVFMEKPIVTSIGDLDRIKACLQVNPALYCSDFYIDVWGAPLMKWIGKSVAPPVLEKIEFSESFEKYSMQDLGAIKRVEGTIVEGTGSAASFAGREWLWNPIHGGVLWDMGYHELILWFSTIGESVVAKSVERYAVEEAPMGAAETYGAVSMTSHSGIQFEFKVGKYIETGDDRAFRIIGERGEVSMIFGDEAYLMFSDGKSKMLARIAGPCLDYTAAAFRDYVESNPKSPHGFVYADNAVQAMVKIRGISA